MGISDYSATEADNKTVPGSPPIEIGKGIHSPQGHDIQRQAIQRMMADLKTFSESIDTNVGTAIHGATEKTTPVDADTIGLIDSAASNVLKKLSWSNIKATLKTYFDTLYPATSDIREKLAADRTYYVRSDGSDSNDGLTNNSGGAFATLQKAYDTALTLDLNGNDVTIKIGNTATLTDGLLISAPLIGGNLIIEGDTSTPSNTVISTTSASAIKVDAAIKVTVRYLKVQTTTSGEGIWLTYPGALCIVVGVEFGACADRHMYASAPGAKFDLDGDYTISGGAVSHAQTTIGGALETGGRTITVSGTPNFTNGFINCTNLSVQSWYSTTFSGSATGKRYVAELNAVINTFGGGASYFPGDVAGTTATGGAYA